MLLSARPLKDVASVNSFRSTTQFNFTEGDSPLLYFQLVDSSLDTWSEGFNPSGRRYMPAAGATLMVSLDSVNAYNKVLRMATQPFAQDPSIWAFQILSSDAIRGTIPMKFALNESSKITNGVVQNCININPRP